jgi:hypothetical protein
LLGGLWQGTGLLFASAICAGVLYSNILRSDWGGETAGSGMPNPAGGRALH